MEAYVLIGGLVALDAYMYLNCFRMLRIENQLEKITGRTEYENLDSELRIKAIHYLSSVKTRDPFIKQNLKLMIAQINDPQRRSRLAKYLRKFR